ncbi:MAG TPA: hypothetical protein VK177_04625 [Flavobacteriales bacterium]|nr:hypothetical protein [Flavobacteriales bacterium]
MKKQLKLLVVFSAILMLAACGGDGKTTIDTGDVKGRIDAGDARMMQGTLYTDKGKYEQAIFDYEDHEIRICPTPLTFEQELAKNEENNGDFGVTVSEVDKGADYIFYKENKDFAGSKTQGYRFLIYKKGKEKNYVIKGGGKMFEPIPTKEKAEKAFKAGKTFEPGD